ncbi:GntR family transcriptional regulator [Haloactinopolyspora alba]|uniref:GntR family transcriptional regulator n=1 Tax=Haloactinopolyspora alba TaxID=648780 RepID=A0A2P8EC82_9ACTN|nr:FCD domain-containing protein [Haloactinopolyspora alba]PSL07037.1 GntR family transcriptional regulator [Haloactinopolyspora alba]
MAAPVLHSSVLDRLGMDITSGVHAAGDVLTLDQLQQRFGVSRTVMREAMRILEAMNLVHSRRRVGIVVRPMPEWNVYDARVIRWRLDGPYRAEQLRTLTELRMAVEPMAAAAAARNAGPAERGHIADLAQRMRETGEDGRLEAFLEHDVAFHTLVLRSSGNEMFAALTDVVGEVLKGRTHHGLMPSPPVPVALATHDEVARAVRDGDTGAAELAMHTLLAEVRSAIDHVPGC